MISLPALFTFLSLNVSFLISQSMNMYLKNFCERKYSFAFIIYSCLKDANTKKPRTSSAALLHSTTGLREIRINEVLIVFRLP